MPGPFVAWVLSAQVRDLDERVPLVAWSSLGNSLPDMSRYAPSRRLNTTGRVMAHAFAGEGQNAALEE